MDFSAKDLADIQRVAGLLNLTVDELIQQRRQGQAAHLRNRNHTAAAAVPRGVPTHFAVADSGDVPVPLTTRGLGEQSAPLPWHHVQVYHRNGAMDVDAFEFDEYADQPSTASVNSEGVQNEGTEVILLNPQGVWYDCDAGLWDFDESAEQHPGQGGSVAQEEDGGESYVSVTPMQLDLDPDSGSGAPGDRQSKDQESVGADWAMISSSPGSISSIQTPMSPTTGSGEKRYHLIAPKAGRPPTQSMSQSSSHKIRKKRSPYQGAKKKDTHLTRQVHACVRCRMQRNRVSNPHSWPPWAFEFVDFSDSAYRTRQILAVHA